MLGQISFSLVYAFVSKKEKQEKRRRRKASCRTWVRGPNARIHASQPVGFVG